MWLNLRTEDCLDPPYSQQLVLKTMQYVHIKYSDTNLAHLLHRKELTNAFKRGINVFFGGELAK